MPPIIVRQGSTGAYHRGFANSPGITLCHHSGQRLRAELLSHMFFARIHLASKGSPMTTDELFNHQPKGPFMTNDHHFIGKTGQRYRYADIARLVREKAPETLGKHIFVQLAALGLLEEMQGGVTPCGLPFTFADKAPRTRKQLTSSAMFHTPGLFRALQNDYRIKGQPRRRAIKILSDGYRLSPEEARGLLSGSIPVEINDAAGTITYELSEGEPVPSEPI